MGVPLSVLILAKNEEQNIADCIRSALFADDEVIPVAEDNLGLARCGLNQVRSPVGIADQRTVPVHFICEDEAAHVIAQVLEILLDTGIEHPTQTISEDVLRQNDGDHFPSISLKSM